MKSLETVEVKENATVLSSRDQVRRVRESLEEKTEPKLKEHARAKRAANERAHLKYLD